MNSNKIEIKNKTILVTGGSGFIGTAITKKLLKEGAIVKSLDTKDNTLIYEKDRLIKIKGSVLGDDDVKIAISGCDYVIHLAAMLGVKKTEEERLDTLTTNILGIKNILDSCVKEKVKKIVFSSSSEVYGEQTKFPISEKNPVHPKSIYAITKLVGEEYLKAYKQNFGLDYSIVRYFNCYGPKQNNNFVMAGFINQALNSESPIIYGSGKQIRAFCYIDDIVEGTYLTLVNEKANSEIFNIGNDTQPISIKDLAEKIILLSNNNGNLTPKYIGLEKSDRTKEREIFKRFPNIEKAKNVLGYKPKVPLDVGIKKTIDWWCSN